jgi:hypothetical protein
MEGCDVFYTKRNSLVQAIFQSIATGTSRPTPASDLSQPFLTSPRKKTIKTASADGAICGGVRQRRRQWLARLDV